MSTLAPTFPDGSVEEVTDNIVLARRIEVVGTGEIRPYENNPRDHTDEQISLIAANFLVVGVLVPILVDHNGVIIAGHARWAAAQQLGLKRIPIIRANHLTEDQVRRFRISDNQLNTLSSFNIPKLAVELKHLTLVEPELLHLTGFQTGEIDAVIQPLQVLTPDATDNVQDPSSADAVTKPGDVWVCGSHRVICGSATKADTYDLLLGGVKVRAVWSDPPYNVKINGHVSGLGTMQHREFLEASGEMTEPEFTGWTADWMCLAKLHSQPGALHYVCMDGAHTYEVLSAARRAELHFKVTCTWAKTNAGMGSLYRQQTEFVHVFKNGGDQVSHVNNVKLGKYGRNRTTLWTYAGANTFRKGRMEDLEAHPTVKPWAMVADAIKDCTAIGDPVLDCFLGSGTTVIAAEKTGRVAYGIELDPLYVDVAVKRWQVLTGKQAVLAETGETFAEVEAHRV